jgi:Putative transposase
VTQCTRTCTASCRPVGCRLITSAGFGRSTPASSSHQSAQSGVSREVCGRASTSLCARRPRTRGATEGLRDPAHWHTFVDALFETDWIVLAKPAFGGASAVLRYLGRYTHRVAISNHRLIAVDGERVTFRWKDYAHGNQWRTMSLTAMEFLRRFVQHVLPRGFVRIRQFGYLASTCRAARLALARRLLRQSSPRSETSATTAAWHCPRCGAPMAIGPILSALQLVTITVGFDTS